jgi:hypothetical protein
VVVIMAASSPRPLLLALFLARWLVACGGADEGRPERPTGTSSQALDQCAAAEQRLLDGWEFQSVLDFEPADDVDVVELEPTCSAEAPCRFYFNYDKAASPRPEGCYPDLDVLPAFEAVTVPEKAGDMNIAQRLPEARCDSSHYAFHLLGSDVATCINPATGRQGWGATLAVTLNANDGDTGLALMPYDASRWDGFSFWARREAGPNNSGILASAKDRYSGRPPDSLKADPYCEVKEQIVVDGEPIPTPDSLKCDGFGLAALAEPEWRFVKIPFTNLQQKGFGAPSPLGELEVGQMSAFEFGFGAGDWDVWIDDLAFYREPR